MTAIFSGRFRLAYLGVKTLSLYVGVFMTCFYWPQFLSSVLYAHGDPRIEVIATLLLTPLGYLILGAACGELTAFVHAGAFALGAVATYALLPVGALDDVRVVLDLWLPALLAVYAVGALAGFRRQLRLFKPAV